MRNYADFFARYLALPLALFIVLAQRAFAAPVTLDQARVAVEHWVGEGTALGCRLGTSVASARTCTTTNGASFHVVCLAGCGFVVTSTDTTREPVVAFSSGDDLVADTTRPLWALLSGDAAFRAASSGAVRLTRALGAAAPSAPSATTAAEAKWARLLSPTVSAALKGVTTVSDMRVAPLLSTQWGQEMEYDGWDCYNLYTPKNYPCGCVATAGAQVMRYFEWPKTSVAPFTCTACTVDDVTMALTTQGGVFDWTTMPGAPGLYVESTTAQRQEIGRLTSDVGIICGMSYAEGGSGAGAYMLVNAFQKFGYSNATAYFKKTGADMLEFRRAVRSNLDAGLPVVVSIAGPSGGHAVVADGYGYAGATAYCHFNMGWSGESDIWYAPPGFDWSDNANLNFTVLNGFVYNVFTNQNASAVIVSGRVQDTSGVPVVGASVRVSKGLDVWRTQTNAQGLYSVFVPAGTYTVSATYASAIASTNVSPAACVTLPLAESSYGSYWSSPLPSVGNLSDVDLVLSAVSSVATPVFTPGSCLFAPSTTVTLSCATPGAVIRYTTDGSNPTATSSIYSAGIPVLDDVVIRARAFADGLNPSAVAMATYTYDASTGGLKGDAFLNPLVITGGEGMRVVSGVDNFTIETGEPHHTLNGGSYYPQYHSAWYAWTAPWSGTVRFRAKCMGNDSDVYFTSYFTAIAVYSGNEFSGLTRLGYAISDDNTYDWLASVEVNVEKGTTYRIACAILNDLSSVYNDAVTMTCIWSAGKPTATYTTPVAVPYSWFDVYYPGCAQTTAAYETLALSPAANGRDAVWQAYLLGLDPTNAASRLEAQIHLVDGVPIVEWNITNAAIGSMGYEYRVLGVTNLLERTWTPQTPGQRFFKVGVVPR